MVLPVLKRLHAVWIWKLNLPVQEYDELFWLTGLCQLVFFLNPLEGFFFHPLRWWSNLIWLGCLVLELWLAQRVLLLDFDWLKVYCSFDWMGWWGLTRSMLIGCVSDSLLNCDWLRFLLLYCKLSEIVLLNSDWITSLGTRLLAAVYRARLWLAGNLLHNCLFCFLSPNWLAGGMTSCWILIGRRSLKHPIGCSTIGKILLNLFIIPVFVSIAFAKTPIIFI